MREVLAPKLVGTLKLRRYGVHAKPVKTMVLFSSIASLLGNAGQINYSAANAALDVLADLDTGQVTLPHYMFLADSTKTLRSLASFLSVAVGLRNVFVRALSRVPASLQYNLALRQLLGNAGCEHQQYPVGSLGQCRNGNARQDDTAEVATCWAAIPSALCWHGFPW